MKKILMVSLIAFMSAATVSANYTQEKEKCRQECCGHCKKCKAGKCTKEKCKKDNQKSTSKQQLSAA